MKSQRFTGFKGLNYHESVDSIHAADCEDVRFNGENGGITNFGGWVTEDYEVGTYAIQGFYHSVLQNTVHLLAGTATKVVVNFGTKYDVEIFSGNGSTSNLSLSANAVIKPYEDRFYALDDGVLWRIEYLDGVEVFGTTHTGWFGFKELAKGALTDPLVNPHFTGEADHTEVIAYSEGYIVKYPAHVELRDSNFRIQRTLDNTTGEKITGIATDSTDYVWITYETKFGRYLLETLSLMEMQSVGSGSEVIYDIAQGGGYLYIATDSYVYRTASSSLSSSWTTKIQHLTGGFIAVDYDSTGIYTISNVDGYVVVFSTDLSGALRSWAMADTTELIGITIDSLEVWYTYSDQQATNGKIASSTITGTSQVIHLTETEDLRLGRPSIYDSDIYAFSQELGLLIKADVGTALWEYVTDYGVNHYATPSATPDDTFFYMFSFVLRDGQELMAMKTGGIQVDLSYPPRFEFHFNSVGAPSLFGLIEEVKIYRAYNDLITYPSEPTTDYYYIDTIKMSDMRLRNMSSLDDTYHINYTDTKNETLISSTSYSDDNGLTRVDSVVIPEVTNFEVYGSRMFYSGLQYDGENYYEWVIWTPENSFETMYWLDDNQRRLDLGAVSEIRGMYQFRGMLAVVGDAKIAVMNGFNQSVVRDIIAVSSRGVCVYDDNLYIVTSHGVLFFDGYNFRDIGRPIFHKDNSYITKSNLAGSWLTYSNEIKALFFALGFKTYAYYVDTNDWCPLTEDVYDRFDSNGTEYYITDKNKVVSYVKDIDDADTSEDPYWESKPQTFGSGFIRKQLLIGTIGYESGLDLKLDITLDGNVKAISLVNNTGHSTDNFGIKSGGKRISFKFSHNQSAYMMNISEIEFFYNPIGFLGKVAD